MHLKFSKHMLFTKTVILVIRAILTDLDTNFLTLSDQQESDRNCCKAGSHLESRVT